MTTATTLATLEYLHNLNHSNTEEAKKTLFYNLLSEWFKDNTEAKRIIAQMARGAEKTIFNIHKISKNGEYVNSSGRADTQYRKVIIEYENDIKSNTKREHAELQLKEYFTGNFNTNKMSDLSLIATDCLRWQIYGVTPESYLGKTEDIKPNEVILKVVESFTLSEENADQFFHFIDRYLFRTETQTATLENILIDFGDSSSLFIIVFGEMLSFYQKHQDEPELKTAYNEWRRFMSIAYGSFEDNIEVFVVHSYLSVFAKLIAYQVISQDNFIDRDEMKMILDGSIFDKYKVKNFVESDFYQWVIIPKYFEELHPQFSKIADRISEYTFDNVQSDILKGVYQKLIDLETRHALGEYYTPDWLCETVVRHFDFEENSRILDPSCGSGSFLLATVNRLKVLHPNITAKEISKQVVGIDIHPLSVQIAKTTLLLSIGKELISKEKKPIFLRVYLSNSLESPQMNAYNQALNIVNLFGEEFSIRINEKAYSLPEEVFKDLNFFDHAIDVADHIADFTKGQKACTESHLQNIIEKNYAEFDKNLTNKFYNIYLALKNAKEKREDSIWKFILQNNYKPFFLKGSFDYIIGNPPWFTYNSIKNAKYQFMLKELADRYEVTPAKKANMPHLEIAAIFMSHCSKYFLKREGQLAFVLPRSFLSAEHHDNTRSGISHGFRITEIWDLNKVSPLFNVPSCVLFADTTYRKKSLHIKDIKGKTFVGRPKQHNATFEEVQDRVKHTDTPFYYTKLQKSSAFSTTIQSESSGGENYYKKFFKQGATIVPRNFYFIDIEGDMPTDWVDNIISVKSGINNEKDAKEPWKSLKLRGQVNSNYIFRTAISKNIVPFGLISPPLVVLPILIEKLKQPKKENEKETIERRVKLLNPHEIQKNANLETFKWFTNVEELWDNYRTENNRKITSWDYVNWQSKLTEQNLNKKYLILYSASSKDANACIYERGSLDLEFFVESKTYVFYTNEIDEAHFLSAFLNSNSANLAIKDFQTMGLFGARDVHKKILEVPLPKYNQLNSKHLQIAELGNVCMKKTEEYIEQQGLSNNDYNVGKERSIIRKLLSEELLQIDKLLQEIVK